MGDLINLNNELEGSREKEVLQMMKNTTISPVLEESEVGVANYTPLPLSRLASYGTAFQPLTTAIQTAVSGAGGSGLYYVNTAGKTMFQMKGTNNFIGSLKSSTGMVGGGQAQMTPLACDPTMLFMAAVLANVEKKLDAIQDMQREMMDFLVQKEKAELKGSLVFLSDVFNNYKYNWNNAMYKNSSYIKVLDIRQEAEKKIAFYREQIIAKVNKKSFIHSDQTVKKQLQAVQDQFKDYQLSLYLLGFSSFLEVILLENFDENYLYGISSKLDNYSLKYRVLYSQCYDEIESYALSSVQTTMLKGIAKASTSVGKFVEKIPVLSKGQADEALIAAGDKLDDFNSGKLRKQMQSLIDHQSNSIRPFIDNIDTVNQLSNRPVRLMVDNENIYIAISA
ncbi:hypothetical protein [Merdimonas faecis]|uniref:hypothetical protein n=1 Tax=Merdimonas faecis TaxID=1653435 RepID=UPI0039909EBE